MNVANTRLYAVVGLLGSLILVALFLFRPIREGERRETAPHESPDRSDRGAGIASRGERRNAYAGEKSAEMISRLVDVGGKDRSDEFVSLKRMETDDAYRYRVVRHKSIRSFLSWGGRDLPEAQETLKRLIQNGYDIESWRGAYLSASKLQAAYKKLGKTPSWNRIGPSLLVDALRTLHYSGISDKKLIVELMTVPHSDPGRWPIYSSKVADGEAFLEDEEWLPQDLVDDYRGFDGQRKRLPSPEEVRGSGIGRFAGIPGGRELVSDVWFELYASAFHDPYPRVGSSEMQSLIPSDP